MIKVKPIELKTSRDFRGLGADIDKAIKLLKTLEPGQYKLKTPEDKNIFLIIEGMHQLQIMLNKRVDIVGTFNTQVVEISDYKKIQDEMDAVHISLDL